MKSSIDYTQNITFYPDKVVCVSEFIHPVSNKQSKVDVMLANRSTVYNGFMSPATKRKITKILTVWLEALEFSKPYNQRSLEAQDYYPVFATFTLSSEQVHDDNCIKRNLLNRLITTLRRNYGVTNYFWRAEKQKNGRIHFHCIFDKYMPNTELQIIWNTIQDDFGYLDNFVLKYGRNNPPSTHVEKIDSSKDAISYVLKYVSKNPDKLDNDNLKIQGRIWGCSDGIRDLKPFQISEHSNMIELLNEMHKNAMVERFADDFFTIYKLDVNDFLNSYFNDIHIKMTSYYKSILACLSQPISENSELTVIETAEMSDKPLPPTQLSLFDLYGFDNDVSAVDKLLVQH